MKEVEDDVARFLTTYDESPLAARLGSPTDWLATKYISSGRAAQYVTPSPLYISSTPLQTWGTATYVAPITTPLTSAMYGRVGLVTDFDPRQWTFFDATTAAGVGAYLRWLQTQPLFPQLATTVHSTLANQALRNRFRRRFAIDCVLFRPDQETVGYTNMVDDIWMAVTDWTPTREIATGHSDRLRNARLTILSDEDFNLPGDAIPLASVEGSIEDAVRAIRSSAVAHPVRRARLLADAAPLIADAYRRGTFVHLYIEP